MTGFGEAREADERISAQVEIRAVNNRHLKLNAKISEPYAVLEGDVERLVRETVRRGTIQLSLRVDRPRRAEDYRLNVVALESYRDQVAAMNGVGGGQVDLASLLGLPGVVEGRRESDQDPREDWPLLARVLTRALEQFHASRAEEGRAMAAELRSLAGVVALTLDLVEARVPGVIVQYQQRLRDRVQNLVAEFGVTIEAKDLIREVSILAERADVAEEITRLRAHLAQFVEVLDEPESGGRKLEFIVQEMGRETNTIGSKANDVEISRGVFEMKGALEKIRELIQNVE
jgi:uncharacterized protein (TIGR00255 family)